jgi:hypothetical protein
MKDKSYSPFTPGNPVPVELFVGRADQIQELLRYIVQISSGRQESVFLLGERGIGKSSLASFLRHFVATGNNVLGIHTFLGGVTTLEEMVHHIFEQLLREAKGQTWYKNIAKFFGSHVKGLGLFGVSVSFSPPEKDLKELVTKFPEALKNLVHEIKKEKSGLLIILDDINGLAEKAEFANWYKSYADEVATHFKDFPVLVMLIGLPEKRDILAKHQPSLLRIFRIVTIEKLSDDDVRKFFQDAFSSVGIEVNATAMKTMVRYSSGLPLLMHEIGDAVFWRDTDGKITEVDSSNGVVTASEKVGQKYLEPKVYRAIRSENYKSILRKLGDPFFSREFMKKEVEEKLNSSERRVFHNFLRRMRDLGVIESDLEGGVGAYKFVNELYPIYIWMESLRAQKKKTRTKSR